MIDKIIKFAKKDTFPGILLMFSGLLAMFVSNSMFSELYKKILDTHLIINVGSFSLDKPILLWINDGLMAVFFLYIGLEIKSEIHHGALSSVKIIVLPGIAALGGIIVPALIFYYFNHANIDALRGWAIPTATDIAFALGVLLLLGSRVPRGITVLLTTIAIFDDIAAIIIISLFYSVSISLISLIFAIIAILILMLMNFFRVKTLFLYLVVGLFLWVCVLKSGVHTTLSGILLAFVIPIRIGDKKENVPLYKLYKILEPWVVYFILPIFAFSNAGISFDGINFFAIFEPIPMGIMLGLFLGKQIGVFSFAYLSVKCGISHLPKNVTWPYFYGMSILCGIGFTMSLFIGSLSSGNGTDYSVLNRLGTLSGSILSAAIGYLFLFWYSKKNV